MTKRRKLVLGGLALVVIPVILVLLSAIPRSTKTGYVARQGYFQLEMLWGRVPLADAGLYRELSETEQLRLEQIPQMQAFATTLGLKVGGHYTTINPTWDHTIWNVSASEPLRFRTVSWWFPIVGRVPYLGFFQEDDADRRLSQLSDEGYDVYKRTAGAYSTLGWFDDPVLPPMLGWSESRLSNTLFHELAHVTLWIPGSVKFNESFASFVGDVSALRYLEHTAGPDSEAVQDELGRVADRRVFRLLLTEVYKDLDTVYSDDTLTDDQKLRRKAELIDSLPSRVEAAELHASERYLSYVTRDPWNNARLGQFRTYNKSPEHFALLLEQVGGDLPAFFERIEAITRGADDPYEALAEAVGIEPDTTEAPNRPTR